MTIDFRIEDGPEELLRVATDGKIHTAGKVFAGWAGYVQYVAKLETVAKWAKLFVRDHDAHELRDALEDLEKNND